MGIAFLKEWSILPLKYPSRFTLNFLLHVPSFSLKTSNINRRQVGCAQGLGSVKFSVLPVRDR